MASVHLATMAGPAGERRVAIKRLLAEDALDEAARQRLADEARLVFRLTHASICQVFDLATSADGTFVVMEYVEGLDLRELVERAGPLELPHALYVAREIARALDYAHRRRDDDGGPLLLVHGDVTPANVLVSCEGEVKLADFGIARALGRAPADADVVAGTPGYLAPEVQVQGPSQRGDLFALGVTLYVALTGLKPSSSGFAPRALRRARPDASLELERLVARATTSDLDERFTSASQLEQALAVELARRFSEFTPSSLARVVAAHRRQGHADDADARDPVEGTLLESMTIATMLERPAPKRGRAAAAVGAAPAVASGTETAPPGAARSRRWPRLAVLAALALVAGFALVRMWPRDLLADRALASAAPARSAARPPPAPTPTAAPTPHPPLAPTPTPTPPLAADHAAAASHRGERAHHHAAAVVSVPVAPAAAGFLTVTARTWGAVYVDGKQVAAETPLYRHPLAVGPHSVKLFQPSTGRYSEVRRAEVRAGEVAVVSFK